LIYRGDVVAKQGEVKLAADVLTLSLAADSTSELRTVVAEGNVRFSKGDRRASVRRAEYDQAKRLIILDQDAVLEDARGNVSGDRVSVYLDEGRTVVEGGEGRVRAVLRPAEETEGGKTAGAAAAGKDAAP
jgi:lipopolysaccharide export system protein LptA